MTVRDPKELFVMLLSDARQSTERSTKIYQEISQAAQDRDIKEALESRAWIAEKDLSAIDRCFQLIGEQPVKLSGVSKKYLLRTSAKNWRRYRTRSQSTSSSWPRLTT